MESSYSQINAVMGHFAADVIKENTGWLGTIVFLSYMIVSVHLRTPAVRALWSPVTSRYVLIDITCSHHLIRSRVICKNEMALHFLLI